VDVGTEQTTFMINDKAIDDEQTTILGDVDIQNQDAAIISEGGQTKHQQKMKTKDGMVKSDSQSISDELITSLNEEEIDDQKQETILMINSDNTNVDSMTKNQRVVDTAIKEKNHLYTETTHDNNMNLGPVIGYAGEPLLPLVEACAPLIDIIPDLSIYVQMALDETSAEPPDGLTIDESAAIRLYTIEWTGGQRSLYSMLNRTLKKDDREHLRPYFKYLKLFVTALVKLPCVPQLTVWRGVTKNASEEFLPGTPVTWWAFSSCTTELTVLENNMYLGTTGSRTLFSVEAINGRTIRAHSHFVTEDEILLLPGTHMKVQSQFSPAPDLHIIHLKQVIPKQVLLELPFEGISNIVNTLF
jgi:hypothetical protein